MNRKKIFSCIVMLLTIITCVGALFATPQHKIIHAENAYTLTFNNEENVLTNLTAPSSTVTRSHVYTSNRSVVYFNYSNVYKTKDTWQIISNNGSITTAGNGIKGIKAITLFYTDNNSKGTIKYGWDSNFENSFFLKNAKEIIDSSKGLEQTYYFNNELPNYFSITCASEEICSIEKMSIIYTCVNATQPSYYKQHTVEFYDSYVDETTGEETPYPYPFNNRRYSYYYGDLITEVPTPYKARGKEFLYWTYEGKQWDFETGVVRSDMKFVAHYDYKYNYIEYVLNNDNTTYTAIISANYNANIILPDTEKLTSGVNHDDAYFKVIGPQVDRKNVNKVILGENCYSVQGLEYFSNIKEVVLSESVKLIKSKAFYNNKKLSALTIEGEIPELLGDSFTLNGGREVILNIFVNELVYNSLQNKVLCGLKVYKIGDIVTNEINMSMQEYRLKTRQQSFNIANYLLSKCQNEFDLTMLCYPYILSYEEFDGYVTNDISNWNEIKEFTIGLVEGLSTDQDKVDAIFDWFGGWTYDMENAYISMIDAFKQKTGVCGQYAMVLHDMLSAIDIPSFYVSGTNGVLLDSDSVEFALNYRRRDGSKCHAWIMAYIDGVWKYLDPLSTLSSGLTQEELVNKRMLVPDEIDLHNIYTIPEEISIENFDEFNLYGHQEFPSYFENKVRNKPDTVGAGGGLILNGNEFETGVTTYFENPSLQYTIKFLDNYEYEIGEIVTNSVVYCNIMPTWSYYCVGSGRNVPLQAAIDYIIYEYSVEFAYEVLEGTNISLDSELNVRF